MTVIQNPVQSVTSGTSALPKPIVIGEPTFRLRCPACATRLVLPGNLASRNGAAPCPRCGTSISWVGQDELARAWSMEDEPAATKHSASSPGAPSPVASPTLVMSKRALMSQPDAKSPKTPPLPFPLPFPAPAPTVAASNMAAPPVVSRHPNDTGSQVKSVPEQVLNTPKASAAEHAHATAQPAASTVASPTTRSPSWPISWIVILVAVSSAILSVISLMLLALSLGSRVAPPAGDPAPSADQQALTATNRELEQAKQVKQQLEDEVQTLKNESQALQVEIDRLRKEVL